MKKWLSILAVLCLLASPVYGVTKELTDETLSSSSEDTGWLQTYVGEADKVTFFITRAGDSSTEAVTVEVTLQASADGTNWEDITWFDVVGGTTAQTGEIIHKDGTYIMRIDSDFMMPHLRLKVIGDPDAWAKQGHSECDIIVTEVSNK